MRWKHKKIIFLYVIFLSFLGHRHTLCQDTLLINKNSPGSKAKPFILAEVGNIKITVDEFISGYEFSPAFIKRGEDSKLQYLNCLINEKLLAIDGYNRKADTTEFVAKMLNAITSDLATEELYRDEILQHIQISDEEIDKVVRQKQVEIKLKWLYSAEEEGILKSRNMLLAGVSFDSLFFLQINDSVTVNDRSVKMDKYSLHLKNPALAAITDSLIIGNSFVPIRTIDGWYIVYLENIWNSAITTQSEMIRLKSEAQKELKKQEIENRSINYLRNLLELNKPVIKNSVFMQLVPYIAKYVLPPDKFSEWDQSENLSKALREFNKLHPDEINNLLFVALEGDSIYLGEFLTWYILRSPYIKFDSRNLSTFIQSLESFVWRMVREKLLIDVAASRGMFSLENVRTQSRWWRDKIVFDYVKNELLKSISIDNDEIKVYEELDDKNNNADNAALKKNLMFKINNKLNSLKKEYEIKINYNLLKNIEVSEENNPGAIEFYTIKKDNLIPHTPYPTIDFIWRQ